ncbi:MAG: phytanoyl-CoA dioxygenase family protein [Hyphomicrobiaceae bacterium]
MPRLSEERVAQWRRDGFMSPFPLLDAAELREAQAGVQRFESWLGEPINVSSEMKWRTMPYLLMPWALKLARDPRILDIVEDFLGPNLLIYTSTFFIKEPHSPTIAAWHQDSTYYGLEPKEEVTVWIALSEANEAAGCMECLPVNGQPRQLRHQSRVVENSVNRGAQVIVEQFDDRAPVAMPLKAGEMSMHHGLCVHRSGPNTSTHRRIGLGLNYIPTHAKPSGTVKTAAMLVRGVDRYNNFEPVEGAMHELSPEAVATHAWAVGLYRDAYLAEEARHAKLSA